ncbi:MAG: 2-oxo acid dehydrogenase subunit E2, partial [Longimicrobiales bacterium]
VGGIARRTFDGGKAEVLALTVVFDHAVVDGAPVGRFIHRLQELLTRSESLAETDPGRAPGGGDGVPGRAGP